MAEEMRKSRLIAAGTRAAGTGIDQEPFRRPGDQGSVRRSPALRCLAALLAGFILLSGCRPSPRTMTLVSGKTAYKGMGVEDVALVVYAREDGSWERHSETRSGYHGSFRFHLPRGRYRVLALKTLVLDSREVHLTGALEELVIEGKGGRRDRLLIELHPSGEGTGPPD